MPISAATRLFRRDIQATEATTLGKATKSTLRCICGDKTRGRRMAAVLLASISRPIAASHRALETVAELPLIFFTRQLIPGFHAQIVELFQRVGAFPKVAQHAVHLQTIVGLVASGVGIAILPSSAQRVSREGVVYRDLDVPDATSWMGLAWVEGDESKLVQNFIATVREAAGGNVSGLPNTDP
jgi:DNA-binding transcriptional LysR family regulator